VGRFRSWYRIRQDEPDLSAELNVAALTAPLGTDLDRVYGDTVVSSLGDLSAPL